MINQCEFKNRKKSREQEKCRICILKIEAKIFLNNIRDLFLIVTILKKKIDAVE